MNRKVITVLIPGLVAFGLAGCGGGNTGSSSSSSSSSGSIGQGLSAKERLTAFGFGQAVMINNKKAIKRGDLALSIPAISSRSTAMNYFSDNAAIGDVAIGYTTAPHTVEVKDVSSFVSGGYGSTVGNFNDYLDAAGTSRIDLSDLSSVFQNNTQCRFINLGQPNTKIKALNLLNQIMSDVSTTNGIFIDHIEPTANLPVPFAYPEELHTVLQSFKASRLAKGKEEPIIAGNFYSLRQHSANSYKAYNPSAFDVVLVEEYGVRPASDSTPSDIIDFHIKYPNVTLIMNTEVSTPNSPSITEHIRAREAVTIAALVGGLHAVDRGIYSHGDNEYARLYLNFPILRPGKPTTNIISDGIHYRRDYKEMIAIYAKQNGTIFLSSASWHDYWDNSGHGAAITGMMTLTAGKSYLLFKDR